MTFYHNETNLTDLIFRLRKPLVKEAEFNRKGKFVLYHGMTKETSFLCQLYTVGYGAKYNVDVENFNFFRFVDENDTLWDEMTPDDIKITGDPTKIREKILEGRPHREDISLRVRQLFTNASLFGNMFRHGSNTFAYISENFNINTPKLNIKKIFDILRIPEELQDKYRSRIEAMELLNNSIDGGHLYQLVFDKGELPEVSYIAQPGGYSHDVKLLSGETFKKNEVEKLLETIMESPEKFSSVPRGQEHDWEYVVALTEDKMLKPGYVEMYRYPACSREQMGKWNDLQQQWKQLAEDLRADLQALGK